MAASAMEEKYKISILNNMKLKNKDKEIIRKALQCYNDSLFHATELIEGEEREKLMQYQDEIDNLWERFLKPDKVHKDKKTGKQSGKVKCQLCGNLFHPGVPSWAINEGQMIKPHAVICNECIKKCLPQILIDDGTLPF
jgi:hypothetical protein